MLPLLQSHSSYLTLPIFLVLLMTDIMQACIAPIVEASTAILRISGLGGKRWKRNVARGGRIGPWLQACFEVLDNEAWNASGPCLYLVLGTDRQIRYVGISRNGLRHRWRTSPAYDAVTMEKLPENQLFHSQCWPRIEDEADRDPQATFEVRALSASRLADVLEKLNHPISAFAQLRDDGESVIASVERWICNHRSATLATWNVAMTGQRTPRKVDRSEQLAVRRPMPGLAGRSAPAAASSSRDGNFIQTIVARIFPRHKKVGDPKLD